MRFASGKLVFLFVIGLLFLPFDHLAAQEPTKEALIATLNELYPLLESKEYGKAVQYFALPEKFLADPEMVNRQLARMIEIQEISLAGIERLNQDGKFGTAVEVFGEERAGLFARKMEADLQISYGCALSPAEVMAIWSEGKFKLVRLDDVGKLSPVNEKSSELDPEELFKKGLAQEKEGKFSKAWPLYAKSHKLGNESKQLVGGIDRCMSRFANVGLFEVGITEEKVFQILGEPHQKVDLKTRQRWVYGSWAVDFRSEKLHEIIDLKGVTKDLFLPTETISVDLLDGREWETQFRERRKGHAIAYLYPEKYTRDWTSQVTMERMLYRESLSAEQFAQEQIDREAKRYPNSNHKVLLKDDSSMTFASEIPIRDDGTSLHKLSRVLKGPKDFHVITYTIRSKDAPTMDTQKMWLQIFQAATLQPVSK
jgi:hypothetical protein